MIPIETLGEPLPLSQIDKPVPNKVLAVMIDV